jgi:hypothetical protein
VSENGAKTWRAVGTFPGVPALTTVSSLLASRHDTNVVFAAFNNMLRGDFGPYLLKSSDRGRTWTSIRSNLPDRDPVWTIAEDHANKNLLFVGTEHGVYTSPDGGQHWMPLRSGLPSVAVRDIQIQRRENDLVIGTFGRGLYILDDYTPLRALAGMNAEGLLAPRATRLYVETPFQRAGLGNGNYVGNNPPYGALLSYVLRADPPAGTDIVVTIKDAAGKSVIDIPAPRAAGLNRVVWNLHRRPDSATTTLAGRGGGGRAGGGRGAASDTSGAEGAQQAAGRGRGGPPRQGPLVPPGVYTIQLARRIGGANASLTPVGPLQRLQVVPLQP